LLLQPPQCIAYLMPSPFDKFLHFGKLGLHVGTLGDLEIGIGRDPQGDECYDECQDRNACLSILTPQIHQRSSFAGVDLVALTRKKPQWFLAQ
jgi:hypothetical protein